MNPIFECRIILHIIPITVAEHITGRKYIARKSLFFLLFLLMNAAIIIAPKACTGTSIPVNIAVIFKLFINRVSLNASTNGGPNYSTESTVSYIYTRAFSSGSSMGYASAMSVILFIIIMLFTILLYRRMNGEDK